MAPHETRDAPDHRSAARAGALRAAGLRITAPRLAVLEALEAAPHQSADSVATGARAIVGDVSKQAVYDVLRALTNAQLVRCIEPAGSVTRYETRVGDNHHHAVCRSCGEISDVACVVGAAPCLDPSDVEAATAGFVVDEAEVVFWGLCAECTNSSNANPLPDRTSRTFSSSCTS